MWKENIRLIKEYIMKCIKNAIFLIKNNKLLSASILIGLIISIVILLIVMSIKKKELTFRIAQGIEGKSLSEDLTNQIIYWVEHYESKNSFINEQYDKFIRNVCIESDLYKKLFDKDIWEKDEYHKNQAILYDDFIAIKKNSDFIKTIGNYPSLHKVLSISKEELHSYIAKYVEKKLDEAKIFSLKMKEAIGFKYSDIESLLKKNEVKKSDYDFFFSQVRILNSDFNKIYTDIEKHNPKLNSLQCILEMLNQKIITYNKLEGIVNDFYRKSYAIVDTLSEKLLQWISGKSKRFCEGEHCNHYEQIFTSLVFKIAMQNSDSKLIDFIEDFKFQKNKNLELTFSDFFKSIFESKKMNKIELIDLVKTFVLSDQGEAYYFDILLSEKTKLTTIQNEKRKFSVAKVDRANKSEINAFVENTFNNDNI